MAAASPGGAAFVYVVVLSVPVRLVYAFSLR